MDHGNYSVNNRENHSDKCGNQSGKIVFSPQPTPVTSYQRNASREYHIPASLDDLHLLPRLGEAPAACAAPSVPLLQSARCTVASWPAHSLQGSLCPAPNPAKSFARSDNLLPSSNWTVVLTGPATAGIPEAERKKEP